MQKYTVLGVVVAVIIVVLAGAWAFAVYNSSQTRAVSSGQSATSTVSASSTPVSAADITAADNGDSFSYTPTSRFSVTLDKTKYPHLTASCAPEGTIGLISNVPSVPDPLYVTAYEAIAPGTCVLSSDDFSVTVVVPSGQ